MHLSTFRINVKSTELVVELVGCARRRGETEYPH